MAYGSDLCRIYRREEGNRQAGIRSNLRFFRFSEWRNELPFHVRLAMNRGEIRLTTYASGTHRAQHAVTNIRSVLRRQLYDVNEPASCAAVNPCRCYKPANSLQCFVVRSRRRSSFLKEASDALQLS